jgi:cytosylglucuronate decarboxylase
MSLPANGGRKRYLFIRILEACSADCFMCGYALSRDSYRFTAEEFEAILPQARALGVEFVRFTGGEPLLHKSIEALIAAGARAGMKMSMITNGQLVPRMIRRLADAGLTQIIVSIDGASGATHDHFRNTPGLFDQCIDGLKSAGDLGLLLRVNTVVGPHNYTEMPELQERLTAIGIRQWELSAIKLERPIAYPDPQHVLAVCGPLYEADPSTRLVPMGKKFYGETEAEQRLFFEFAITPRPTPPLCHLVGDVIYIDAREGRGFGCSLLPHRDEKDSGGGVRLRNDRAWTLDVPEFADHMNLFQSIGPSVCRGCSTTAAGYSDRVAAGHTMRDWEF